MKKIIALIIILCSQNAFSQDWIYVTTSISSGNKDYIRSEYVSRTAYSIKVWTKSERKVATIYNEKAEKITVYNVEIMSLCEYDCEQRKHRLISSTTYNSNNAVIETFDMPYYRQYWSEVVPDSMGEAKLEKVCELFNN